ncbi:hypothetical protein HDZ31DRAFT_70885 [Schizophyllum fasciatum]
MVVPAGTSKRAKCADAAECSTARGIARGPIGALRDLKLENPKIPFDHFERCFLKTLVREITNKTGLHETNGRFLFTYVDGKRAYNDYAKHFAGFAHLVDYSQDLVPSIVYRFEDPLPVSPPHVYVRVRLGLQTTTVLMGTLSADY